MLQCLMLIALLMLLQVVQANDFVSFDVCYLDFSASPWEFRPHEETRVFYVRPEEILHVTAPTFPTAGLECVRVCSAHGCRFVVGTPESVIQRLRGKKNASEKSRK